MSLEEKLAALREGSAKRIPEDKRAIITKAGEELLASGIMDKTIKVGDTLPAFTLNNADGNEITSAGILAQGPMVLTIYRGHW